MRAWQHATNHNQRQVNWQFTTSDARIKLRHLYPKYLAYPNTQTRQYAGGHAPHPHLSWSKLHRSIAHQALEGNGGLEDNGGA